MLEENKLLSLLQLTVPADTALMVPAQIQILELLGIVSSPQLKSSVEMAAALVPPNTPATLHGLVILLGKLIEHHPKSNKTHTDELSKLLNNFGDVPDAAFTYGTFLSVCGSLVKAIHKHRNKPAERPVERKPQKNKSRAKT